MNENLKKQISETLNAKIGFDSSKINKTKLNLLDPDLILINDSDLYCIIKYLNSDFKELTKLHENTDFKIWYPRDYDLIEYYSIIKELYGLEKAMCMMNLFYDIRGKFNYFHMSNHKGLNDEGKDRLFHCSILISDEDYKLVRETLEVIQSKYNPPRSFDELITTYKFSDYTILSMNISVLYHLINGIWFGYKIGILDKHGNMIKTK